MYLIIYSFYTKYGDPYLEFIIQMLKDGNSYLGFIIQKMLKDGNSYLGFNYTEDVERW